MNHTTAPPKTDTDPAGTTIYFDEEAHLYWTDKCNTFVSGTSFVKHYFPEFDGPKIAKRKTLKECPDEQLQAAYYDNLLAQWERKRDMASRMGTRVHLNCEMQIQGKPLPYLQPEHDRESAIMRTAYNAVAYLLGLGHKVWAAEKIVFSEGMGVSGTIDLIMYDPRTGDVFIIDWKTNEKIEFKNNFNDFGFEPIRHIDHCSGSHYTLQLSLYEYLLRTQGYVKPGTSIDRYLIHLTPEGYKVIPVPYWEAEVITLRNHMYETNWHLPF